MKRWSENSGRRHPATWAAQVLLIVATAFGSTAVHAVAEPLSAAASHAPEDPSPEPGNDAREEQAPGPADDAGGEQARLRIGVVLSGGGAGGLAHVGVLRWLEENRVPIDLIVGTSMGGLVAGIYASGSDTAEMDELLATISWPEVLSGEAPYALKSFRRKEDAVNAPATFELGLRDGFRLPPGIDAGHHVGLVLDRIAFPYSGIDSFDQLPTPFACVAVDLRSGDEVVFRSGRLAGALRATMSYPGWFTPVSSGDRVLIDGGVLNNLPTDVVLQMGADVVIAVDLGMNVSQEAPFDSVLGVMNRTLTVMMRANSDRNAALADVLIAPDVSPFGFADFDRSDELVAVGYDATATLSDVLSGYAVDETAWRQHLAGRAERRQIFHAVPEFIDIEGTTDPDGSAVDAAVSHHVGIELDPDHLDDDLTRVAGWGRYNVVGYEQRFRDQTVGLGIDVHAKTYGPPFVRPIVDMRGSEFGEALIAFGGRFTFYDVAGANSEWRTDATYGQTTEVATELFVALGHEGFFLAPRAIAGQQTQFLYEGGDAVAQYEVERIGGGGDVGYLFGPRSQLRFGVDLEFQRAGVKVGDPLLEKVEGMAGSVRAEWLFDGTNSPLIPTRGVRFGTEASWVFENPQATEDIYQAGLSVLVARPLSGRFSFIGSAAGGTTFNGSSPPLRQFLLGGPMRLGALGIDELRGSNFFLGRAGVLWALADENRLSFFGKFWLAAVYEIGDAFEKKASPFHDVSFGLAGETILGAVFVGGAIGEDRSAGFFFAVGRLF